MVDTDRLRKALKTFSWDTHQSNGNSSDPCTIRDYNNLVQSIEKVLRVFIDELERE